MLGTRRAIACRRLQWERIHSAYYSSTVFIHYRPTRSWERKRWNQRLYRYRHGIVHAIYKFAQLRSPKARWEINLIVLSYWMSRQQLYLHCNRSFNFYQRVLSKKVNCPTLIWKETAKKPHFKDAYVYVSALQSYWIAPPFTANWISLSTSFSGLHLFWLQYLVSRAEMFERSTNMRDHSQITKCNKSGLTRLGTPRHSARWFSAITIGFPIPCRN